MDAGHSTMDADHMQYVEWLVKIGCSECCTGRAAVGRCTARSAQPWKLNLGRVCALGHATDVVHASDSNNPPTWTGRGGEAYMQHATLVRTWKATCLEVGQRSGEASGRHDPASLCQHNPGRVLSCRWRGRRIREAGRGGCWMAGRAMGADEIGPSAILVIMVCRH